MSEGILRITLLSDTCTSNGGIYNAAVDTEAVYDDYGLPYIPGRRIKGCLRECALEINDWGGEIPIGRLFGQKGNQRGLFTIRNAYIAGRDQLIRDLNAAAGSVIANPQNVLQSYTALRSQTAVSSDTGVAKRNSLRTMRVVKAGTVLEARVSFPEENREQLDMCCSVFRHMGISRTRGFGELKAELLEDKSGAEQVVSEHTRIVNFDTDELAYELELLEPVVCKSVERQESRSQDYIEGARLLGCVIGSLKKNGKDVEQFLSDGNLRVSNAYLMDSEGHRLTEVSAAFYGIKNDSHTFLNKLYEKSGQEEKRDSNGQPRQLGQLKHCYVYQNRDQLDQYDVAMEERYHHSLPDDKSIGRALGGEDGDGIFYQISSIRAGQKFKGRIYGDPATIREIGRMLPDGSLVSIGYGSSAEYGLCRLTYRNEKEEHRKAAGSRIAATLVSPAIVYGRNASYSTNPEDLYEEILCALHLSPENKKNGIQYSRITSVGGFNVTWGLRKPTQLAFDKGMTVVIPLDRPAEVEEGTCWIGERNLEGYGECRIRMLTEDGAYEGTRQKPQEERRAGRIDLEHQKTLQTIADNLFRQYMEETAGRKAVEAAKELNKGIWLPTVSNMLTMCREDGSLREVQSDCKARYDVVDRGKRQKGQAADRIIKDVQSMFETDSQESLADRFMEEYDLENFHCDGSSEMEYLHEYLIQLKYILRRSGEEEEAEK